MLKLRGANKWSVYQLAHERELRRLRMVCDESSLESAQDRLKISVRRARIGDLDLALALA